MRFRHVRLHAPQGSRSILESFYIDQLGLTRIDEQTGVKIGETGLVFASGPGEPFYHFALLVPGNRFDEALEWIGERTDLLPDPESGQVVFDFDNWDALACYFHDPVGNIVELIAHRGIDESSTEGHSRWRARRRLELGVATRPTRPQRSRRASGLGSGTATSPTRRAGLVGQKARTFIVSSRAAAG
jgi:catechol-2,3-dioxygenase